MARYSEHDTSKIYEAADLFRTNCLLGEGSLLFGDTSVWRPDVLEQIHKSFVATPDEGDRTFIDKFKDQVGKAGQGVSRLAGEILSLYFLFPSNVGGIRKRQLVNEVLSWGYRSPTLYRSLSPMASAVGVKATTPVGPLRSHF